MKGKGSGLNKIPFEVQSAANIGTLPDVRLHNEDCRPVHADAKYVVKAANAAPLHPSANANMSSLDTKLIKELLQNHCSQTLVSLQRC